MSNPQPLVESWFPNLAATKAYELTSPYDEDYNCIAYAAGDTGRWWWPPLPMHRSDHWPSGAPVSESPSAFVAAFETLGFQQCSSPDLEDGYEKVAIYAKNGATTHAARQLGDGRWVTKAGMSEDFIHDDLLGVAGELYGDPVAFLRRPTR